MNNSIYVCEYCGTEVNYKSNRCPICSNFMVEEKEDCEEDLFNNGYVEDNSKEHLGHFEHDGFLSKHVDLSTYKVLDASC